MRTWDGNALKRQQIAYNEAATLGELDRVQSVFTSELIRTWQDVGDPSPVPVFIVGMARSGSTLVEQILASHPQVFGAGELKHFDGAVKQIRTKFGDAAIYPELVSGMTDEDFRDLGVRYLAEIERLAPDSIRITDKAPGNFMSAGLIHLALPNAQIIHTVRNPVDTCLSCFSKLFNEGQNHTYDLAELGRYYRHYQELMGHWHRVLPPGRILDVRFSNRPFGVKHFQTIHHYGVDVAHGLVLLFGIGTKALPLWDSKTRWNNLCHGVAVTRTAGPSGHANSPHPSSREGHHSTAGRNSSFLLLDLILHSFHAAAAACSRVQRNSVPSTQIRCMITANRRARATIAFFIPRRLAICIAQALSHDHFFEYSMLCAAS